MLKDEQDLKSLHDGMPQNWMLNLLKRGRCILLCDGLDEIPDVATRQRVAKWLDDQINHTDWRENLFLVTARPAGYESAPLGNVRNLEVQPFDWDDTRAFIRRWYRANRVITMKPGTPQRDIDDHASQDAEALLAKLRDHARLGVLTSNPLLLTMVCLMHEMGQLPGSRSQLYKEICEVHLERWRRRNSTGTGAEPAKKETWNAEQKLSVLRPLACHLMKRGESESATDSKRLSTDEMLEIAAPALDHIGVKSDRDSRKQFFQDLHDESGLWLQLDPDQWGFAHLSFQEYLCADQWFTIPGAVPHESEWPAYFEHSWWRETLLLYASKTTDLRPLIRAALDMKSPRSLSFLYALEQETVSIPGDLRSSVNNELNQALASQVPAFFTPAAEAWLLRQQEIGYSRIDDNREVSSWVTQAEYQLFLNEVRKPRLYILHRIGLWFTGEARSPALGMSEMAALDFCSWLNNRFPEFRHRLGTSDPVEWNLLQHSEWSTWRWSHGVTINCTSSGDIQSALKFCWSTEIPDRLNELSRSLSIALVLALDINRARARSIAIDRSIFRRNDLTLDVTLALEVALSRAFALELDLHLDRARARAFARVLDLALSLDFDLSNSQWKRRSHEIVRQIQSSPSLIARNRWRVFQPLFQLWALGTRKIDSAAIYRRFLVTSIDVIHEYDPRLITAELQPLEYLMRLLVDREDGKVTPFEGIRVIRERRT